MEYLFQPTVLMPLSVVAIVLGAVFASALRKAREKELQCHHDLRVREMAHEQKMKELELELERARQKSA